MKIAFILIGAGLLLFALTLLPQQHKVYWVENGVYEVGDYKLIVQDRKIPHWSGGETIGSAVRGYNEIIIYSTLNPETFYRVCNHEVCLLKHPDIQEDSEGDICNINNQTLVTYPECDTFSLLAIKSNYK